MFYPISFYLHCALVVAFIVLGMSSAHAVPVAEERCAEGDQQCVPEAQRTTPNVASIAAANIEDTLERDVFKLLGAQFVNLDVVKLLDQRTAATLNTAVYPMKKGQNLIDSYVRGMRSASTGHSFSSKKRRNYQTETSKNSFWKGYRFGRFKGNSWAKFEKPKKFRKRHKDGEHEKEELSLTIPLSMAAVWMRLETS
ncbi:MAG: hypothetical protein AAF387_21420 [Pseudomonadota bacterium]